MNCSVCGKPVDAIAASKFYNKCSTACARKAQMQNEETVSVYSLRKIKTFTGREGYGLNADIYRDDKKIGFVYDDANGGQPNIDIRDAGERQLFVQFVTQWFETTGLPALRESFPDVAEIEHSAHMKMENWIDTFVDDYKNKQRLDRLSKKKTLFRLRGDKSGEYRVITQPYSSRVQQYLDQYHAGQVIEIWGQQTA